MTDKFYDQKMYREIGAVLKQLRESHSLTLREADERTGINYATLRRYEAGKTRPTKEAVKQILEGYHESEDTFYQMLGDFTQASDFSLDNFDNVIEAVKEMNEDQLTRLYYYIGGILRK